MKEHIQLTGTKSWYGDQLLELQHENLEVLHRFFKEVGPCIINGCEVTVASTGMGGVPLTWNIAAGIVAIDHADGFKVCRFPGASGVDFASGIYLYVTKTAVTGRYKGGITANVAFTYAAAHATGAVPTPGSPLYLPLNSTANQVFTTRFFDALGAKALGSWQSLTLAGTGVSGTLKCKLDRIGRLLHIQGSITFASFSGNGVVRQIIAPTPGIGNYWPIGFEPDVRQYFKAHREYDPAGASYIRETSTVDYLTDLDCWADADGLFVATKTPASGSSYTVKINACVQVD